MEKPQKSDSRLASIVFYVFRQQSIASLKTYVCSRCVFGNIALQRCHQIVLETCGNTCVRWFPKGAHRMYRNTEPRCTFENLITRIHTKTCRSQVVMNVSTPLLTQVCVSCTIRAAEKIDFQCPLPLFALSRHSCMQHLYEWVDNVFVSTTLTTCFLPPTGRKCVC